ncbi:hypothetical protein GF323_03065 [Candidatus Woesearchaeota archaeon]|nr:hypothetical protein [Candidatus Woesearchaeota archaeon]
MENRVWNIRKYLVSFLLVTMLLSIFLVHPELSALRETAIALAWTMLVWIITGYYVPDMMVTKNLIRLIIIPALMQLAVMVFLAAGDAVQQFFSMRIHISMVKILSGCLQQFKTVWHTRSCSGLDPLYVVLDIVLLAAAINIAAGVAYRSHKPWMKGFL